MSIIPLFDLTGKKAVVTGGSIGIGRACATALAMAGADVAIVARNKTLGEHAAESIRALGVDSIFIQCDVAKQDQVKAMMSTVVQRFGCLDIAVNNAGFGIFGETKDTHETVWNRVIDVNLKGTFFCIQEQVNQMIQQQPTEGKIINMASIYGTVAGGHGAYNAAKAGVIHLSKTMAVELGRFNINVNCISPSWTMTPAMSSETPEHRQRMREVTPLGHVQRPEDLYGATVYLASKASDYVTGHNLIVDGGHTLNTWLESLQRDIAPRISPNEEIAEMEKDLQAMGVTYEQMIDQH